MKFFELSNQNYSVDCDCVKEAPYIYPSVTEGNGNRLDTQIERELRSLKLGMEGHIRNEGSQ